MKKILIILLFVFILTGCNNVISIDFNDKVDTKINVSFSLPEYKKYSKTIVDDKNLGYEIEAYINEIRPISGNYDEMFKENYMNIDGDNYKGEYEYTYTYSEFRKNDIFYRCFDSFVTDEENGILRVFLKGNSRCAPFTLKVKADNRMVNNNADKTKKGEYIWEVKEENNEIRFDISEDVIESSGISTGSIIYLIIGAILAIVSYILITKIKK